MLVVCGQVHAQLSEKFEPRQGETSGVRNLLTANCWSFPEMNISRSTGMPVEGSQSMVSAALTNPKSLAGFYTPFVWVEPSQSLSFSFKLSGTASKSAKAWTRLLLEDADEQVTEVHVESIHQKTSGMVQTFEYRFKESTPKGAFRLYVNFQGKDCDSRISVDNIFYTGLALGCKPNCSSFKGLQLTNCLQAISQEQVQGAGILNLANQQFRLFPNPNQGKFVLEGTFGQELQARVALFDLLGKEIWSQQIQTSDKTTQYAIDIHGQKPGLYFLQIKTGNQSHMQRFQIK